MAELRVVVKGRVPEGTLPRLAADFPAVEFRNAPDAEAFRRHAPGAAVVYGFPTAEDLAAAPDLRWLQLQYAGVPADLLPVLRQRGILLTNTAGLYGPSIAEHALALLVLLARNLHVALRNQAARSWDRTVARGMFDLRGRTLGVIGVGNIGRAVARLARAYGMRVVGCCRSGGPRPFVDHVYPCGELHALLGEADAVVVAAPLTARTEGMLGPAEFRAMRRGVLFVNVSRGAIAREEALLEALASGHVAGAGLDAYAVEPLPADHPFWSLPQVVVSPHYSGEVVNASPLPAERFARNLRSWLANAPLEGVVNLEWGY